MTGRVRLGRSTKQLGARVRPGDIAVIDHPDLDRVSAALLRDRGVAAVVNLSCSASGRYPNEGPAVLLAAGVALLDAPGAPLFEECAEGEQLTLTGDRLLRGAHTVATGRRHSPASVAAARAAGDAALPAALEEFTANTLAFLRQEGDLFFHGVGLPALRTPLRGRHVLVVARGYDYREDLASLRSYVRDVRPALVGVDGGADALLESGLRPDVIIGDMDSVSTRALQCGAELVVHGYPDGRAPGLERTRSLGLPAHLFPTGGTSEDAALLLADAAGAELIVAVGTHVTLVEFLDKGRQGMASTFLVRLRVGPRLVDAKGVSRLYRARISGWLLLSLVAATLVTFAAALAVSEASRTFLLLAWGHWLEVWHDVAH